MASTITIEEAGCARLEQAFRDRLVTGPLQLHRSHDVILQKLTNRQREVVDRLRNGQGMSAIAASMHIATSTARTHLSQAFAAFGVHTQAELLALLGSGASLSSSAVSTAGPPEPRQAPGDVAISSPRGRTRRVSRVEAAAPSSLVRQLLDIVSMRSVGSAATWVLAQLDAGWGASTLVNDVLVPVQVEMGDRWQRNLVTTADEHAATAVVDAALATLVMTTPQTRVPDRGTLAVVCAEGDWHTLPSRMAAELWRGDGWDVVFLGGSLPPADLCGWLESAQPDALAVTCSVPLWLPGLLRMSEAATDAGVLCVAGGRALGADSRRADALGIRWADSAAGLASAIDRPQPTVQPEDLDGRRHEAEQLDAMIDEIVQAALRALIDAFPGIRNYTPRQRAHTKQDYRYIVQFLSAAVLCDDATLFTRFVAWLQTVLTSRGLPPSVLPASLAALVGVLPRENTRTHAIWDESTFL